LPADSLSLSVFLFQFSLWTLDLWTFPFLLGSAFRHHVENLVYGSSFTSSGGELVLTDTNRSSSRRRRQQLRAGRRRRRLPPRSCVLKRVCLSAERREMQKADGETDISELALPPTIKMHIPDPDDILNFTLTIEPDEGWPFFSRFLAL
jgi:hypothetical protein